VVEEAMQRMNMTEITNCYGLTETSPVFFQTSWDDTDDRKINTVGRQHDPVEVRIIDPIDGHICGPGEPGEVCCKGYNVMKGYYKMPDKTAEAIDEDGFLHSGDLGVLDEHGYCKITGRIKDMIIRGGENIYPLEIENFLLKMPGVLDAQVVGSPDEVYGEIVVAFIRQQEGFELSEEGVRSYAHKRMARYKAPKYVFFVDEYPETTSKKVQKFKLREMAAELVKEREQG
jgi:fatty-acyl-CoA synthase